RVNAHKIIIANFYVSSLPTLVQNERIFAGILVITGDDSENLKTELLIQLESRRIRRPNLERSHAATARFPKIQSQTHQDHGVTLSSMIRIHSEVIDVEFILDEPTNTVGDDILLVFENIRKGDRVALDLIEELSTRPRGAKARL